MTRAAFLTLVERGRTAPVEARLTHEGADERFAEFSGVAKLSREKGGRNTHAVVEARFARALASHAFARLLIGVLEVGTIVDGVFDSITITVVADVALAVVVCIRLIRVLVVRAIVASVANAVVVAIALIVIGLVGTVVVALAFEIAHAVVVAIVEIHVCIRVAQHAACELGPSIRGTVRAVEEPPSGGAIFTVCVKVGVVEQMRKIGAVKRRWVVCLKRMRDAADHPVHHLETTRFERGREGSRGDGSDPSSPFHVQIAERRLRA